MDYRRKVAGPRRNVAGAGSQSDFAEKLSDLHRPPDLQFTPSRARGSGYTFGSLNWRDGQHVVRSPIAVAV
ncbi:hypothetical protein WN943_004859 [Citrus x changshan-huyou]